MTCDNTKLDAMDYNLENKGWRKVYIKVTNKQKKRVQKNIKITIQVTQNINTTTRGSIK